MKETIFPDEPIKIGDKFIYPTWEGLYIFDLSGISIWWPNEPKYEFGFTGFRFNEDMIKGMIKVPLPKFFYNEVKLKLNE